MVQHKTSICDEILRTVQILENLLEALVLTNIGDNLPDAICEPLATAIITGAWELLTEYNTDQSKDDQLGNNQESEVACDDSAIQP